VYEPLSEPPLPPPFAARRRFQDRKWLHITLLVLTVVTTTYWGINHYFGYLADFARRPVRITTMHLVLSGFWYSGTLLLILGAHELGHYLACRYYQVDASLPFFIPMPLALTGTLGAFIRIREPIPTKRMLFDIGIAGPLAGFVFAVPALFLGVAMSPITTLPPSFDGYNLGEPLLFKIASFAIVGPVREGFTINIHPMVFAAWFGMLATALNLLPFGQLDGGHITYATLGRWSTPISIATVGSAVAMTFVSISWAVMTIMMLVMLLTLGPRHPRVLDEHEPIGMERNLLAIFALVMFILCFTPVPIQLQDLVGTG